MEQTVLKSLEEETALWCTEIGRLALVHFSFSSARAEAHGAVVLLSAGSRAVDVVAVVLHLLVVTSEEVNCPARVAFIYVSDLRVASVEDVG